MKVIDLDIERTKRKWKHYKCLLCKHPFVSASPPEDCPNCHGSIFEVMRR